MARIDGRISPALASGFLGRTGKQIFFVKFGTFGIFVIGLSYADRSARWIIVDKAKPVARRGRKAVGPLAHKRCSERCARA